MKHWGLALQLTEVVVDSFRALLRSSPLVNNVKVSEGFGECNYSKRNILYVRLNNAFACV